MSMATSDLRNQYAELAGELYFVGVSIPLIRSTLHVEQNFMIVLTMFW